MSRGGYRGRGIGLFIRATFSFAGLSCFFAGRGGGRGGFQSRDFGPPDTVIGEETLFPSRHTFTFLS